MLSRHPAFAAVAGIALAACTRVAGVATTSTAASTRPAHSGQAGSSGARPKAFSLSRIRHVFVIVLENESSTSTFGSPSADPYLAKTLVGEGALVSKYYGIGHNSADNYIGLVSGQPPNPATQQDCQSFSNFTRSGTSNGLQDGNGCVYGKSVQNIGTQLSSAGFTWKAYMQDMGNVSSREAAACGHPHVGSPDNTEGAAKGDGYATRHDPFVYFHSVIKSATYCDAHVVALGSTSGAMPKGALPGETGLATDLKSAATTPNLSFVTPNLCLDGHDYPCTNQKAPGSSRLADIDAFLKTWVPLILASPAYRADGLLLVTFDEAVGDAKACCNEKADPVASPPDPKPGVYGPGGGKVGLVAVSRFVRPGTKDTTYSYNHYSLLATLEKIFGLTRLGDARGVPRVFGSDVFTNPSGVPAG